MLSVLNLSLAYSGRAKVPITSSLLYFVHNYSNYNKLFLIYTILHNSILILYIRSSKYDIFNMSILLYISLVGLLSGLLHRNVLITL